MPLTMNAILLHYEYAILFESHCTMNANVLNSIYALRMPLHYIVNVLAITLNICVIEFRIKDDPFRLF